MRVQNEVLVKIILFFTEGVILSEVRMIVVVSGWCLVVFMVEITPELGKPNHGWHLTAQFGEFFMNKNCLMSLTGDLAAKQLFQIFLDNRKYFVYSWQLEFTNKQRNKWSFICFGKTIFWFSESQVQFWISTYFCSA